MSEDIMSVAKLNLSTLQQTQLAQKEVSSKETEQLEKAAEQFEAIFLQQMVNSMWSAVPNEGLLSGSNEEALYRDMFNQAITEEMAKTQSLGVKDLIIKEMQSKK